MIISANKYTLAAESGTATITGHIVLRGHGSTKRVEGLTVSTNVLLGEELLDQAFVTDTDLNQILLFNITLITGSAVYVGIRNSTTIEEDAGLGNTLLAVGDYSSNPIQLGYLPGGY